MLIERGSVLLSQGGQKLLSLDRDRQTRPPEADRWIPASRECAGLQVRTCRRESSHGEFRNHGRLVHSHRRPYSLSDSKLEGRWSACCGACWTLGEGG